MENNMTSSKQHPFVCPNCSKKYSVTLYDVINVGTHPQLHDDLFAAKINTTSCPGCGEVTFIEEPLTYYDPKLEYCVHLVPSASLEDPTLEVFEQFDEHGRVDLSEKRLPAYIPSNHVVFDVQELLTYIFFRRKLAEFYPILRKRKKVM